MSEKIKNGYAIYTKFVLSFYDIWVIWISNSYIWKCPSKFLLANYNKNVSAKHLDIGVGTGYFLNKCTFPTQSPELALLDINSNSLQATSKKIARYNPICYKKNIFEYVDIKNKTFDSIGLNYLFHCLPGILSEKLNLLANVDHLLSSGGSIFGALIVPQKTNKNKIAEKLMQFYNKKGIFSNTRDSVEMLEKYLKEHYSEYKITLKGYVVLFSAVK